VPEKQAIRLDAPVVEVMLLEDRAQVIRRGKAVLPKGASRIEVPGVAPVLSDKTLTARVLPPARARVSDAQVVRFLKALREERPLEVRELEQALEAARREVEKLFEGSALLNDQLKSLDRFEELLLQELKQDAAWNRDTRTETGDQLDHIREQAASLHAESNAILVQAEKRRENMRDLERRLAQARDPATIFGANLATDVQAEVDGPCEIEFAYIVPGACWRPWHTATRIPGDHPRTLFRSDACVWQNTGEDWTGVSLLFSTERASLGVEPPALESDVIEARPKPPTVKVAEREQAVQTTGLGAAAQEAAELPGIDDGGEIFAVRSPAKADIPSDGRPYRVPYGSFEADAESGQALMAELAPAVISKTVQVNAGRIPLLAGPVDLIGEGGFAGRTQVKLVAPNERFALGWGPDNSLRVHREVEQVDEEPGLMSNTLTSRRVVTVRLSNIGAEERVIKVTERVPVSEIEPVEIAVNRKETTQGHAPDENGFLNWEVRLPPFGREILQLVYTIRKRKGITGI